MRLLLDTHAAAWWWREDERLPSEAREAIRDPRSEVFLSPVCLWELATKHRLGKWPEAGVIIDAIDRLMAEAAFRALPITVPHARLAGALDWQHRDPFDRILVAQAVTEAMTLVTNDGAIRQFSVMTLWNRSN